MLGLVKVDLPHVCTYWWDNPARYELLLKCFINRFPALDDDIIPYLHEAGFSYVDIVTDDTKLHPTLINVLLEQWRPETHTFHFPYGETTITLEDVAYYIGLLVDENPITCMAHGDLLNLYKELLGLTLTNDDLDGGKIYIKFWTTILSSPLSMLL
ncbi:protein MAIN-LIKE 1-like [Hibiscus syriacus]|uniref:protein MAIN-LIKE 1-like n=1 Tax=Hibiscus syriacus TaxID=106335 RepID=UPI00192317CD|nr:protein MAIN-LIKE 1-like [Hibiscus syriacus]